MAPATRRSGARGSAPAKPRVWLIHWNDVEARERSARLNEDGLAARAFTQSNGKSLKALRAAPPDAYVIDLSRLPSQGRDVALTLRTTRKTRTIPLVFVGGEKEKVDRVRETLPDAIFTTWPRVGAAVRRAVTRPLKDPVVPTSNLAGYSGTPLPKKLGIKEGSRVAVLGAPAGFEKTLGRLPEGALLTGSATARSDMTLWFVRAQRDLERGIAGRVERIGPQGLWICWPKRASGVMTDITEAHVRALGLGAGLVDFKIAAIDSTWSGLRFTVSKSASEAAGG